MIRPNGPTAGRRPGARTRGGNGGKSIEVRLPTKVWLGDRRGPVPTNAAERTASQQTRVLLDLPGRLDPRRTKSGRERDVRRVRMAVGPSRLPAIGYHGENLCRFDRRRIAQGLADLTLRHATPPPEYRWDHPPDGDEARRRDTVGPAFAMAVIAVRSAAGIPFFSIILESVAPQRVPVPQVLVTITA